MNLNSFGHPTADSATAATQNQGSARRTQTRIRQGASVADFFPNIEGLSQDEFQQEYGGLGGAKTGMIVQDIQKRLSECEGLELGTDN
jgi:hypothetical protein